MNSQNYWQMFLETGAPEMYLLYNEARKVEQQNVFEDKRPGASYIELQ